MNSVLFQSLGSAITNIIGDALVREKQLARSYGLLMTHATAAQHRNIAQLGYDLRPFAPTMIPGKKPEPAAKRCSSCGAPRRRLEAVNCEYCDGIL